MAGSVNKAVIVGNLGRDPEVRKLGSGDPVVNLRVATSETWKNKDGERQERTEWHSVVIFNENLAKVAEQYLRKGSKVYLEGQLQTRKWTDSDNNERYSTEIVLQRFRGELTILDGKSEGGDEAPASGAKSGSSNGGGRRPTPASNPRGGSSGGRGGQSGFDLDDEIPF